MVEEQGLLQHAAGEREDGGLRAILHSELVEQQREAILDRAFHQAERFGDFLVAEAGSDELQELRFPARQAHAWLGFLEDAPALDLAQEEAAVARAGVTVSSEHDAHRIDQLMHARFRGDECIDSSPSQREDVFLVASQTVDHDLRRRTAVYGGSLRNASDRSDEADERRAVVRRDQNDVRVLPIDQAGQASELTGFCDDTQAFRRFQEVTQALAHSGLGVRHHQRGSRFALFLPIRAHRQEPKPSRRGPIRPSGVTARS